MTTREFTALWQVFPHVIGEIDPNHMPSALWMGISSAARNSGDATLDDISMSISFSITAMERHILALSNEYGRELHYAIQEGKTPDERFSSVETYDLWLSIHSFLLAAGSTRDYLAQALAGYVFHDGASDRGKSRIDSMAGLLRYGKRFDFLNSHPIGQYILRISDKKNPESWLSDLSEYRDKIVHRSPITAVSTDRSLRICHTGAFKENNVLQLLFPLPSRLQSPASDAFTDSLVLMKSYYGKLADLALRIGRCMPYSPESIELNADDIIEV